MDKINLTPFLITTLVVIIGWFIGHQLTISRNVKDKRTETKIKYLIEAYRKLENISHRDNPNKQDFETAIADIQLLGTKKQVQLAQNIAKEFAKNKSVLFDDLLKNLRKDLRELLKLEKLSSDELIVARWKNY